MSTRSITAQTAALSFYDIESLSNAFTLCLYAEDKRTVFAFYLLDDAKLTAGLDLDHARQRIIEANPALPAGTAISFHDLSTFEGNDLLGRLVGVSDSDLINNPKEKSSYGQRYRLTCDTDADYDPFYEHPFLCGYNSANYDTVILAIYLHEAFSEVDTAVKSKIHPQELFTPTTAKRIRGYNDMLFSEEYRSYMPSLLTKHFDGGWDSGPSSIRANMLRSGRHLDVARFNEVQQKVGLKRLLGGLGRQIMESDRLSGPNTSLHTAEDFYELMSYNVSDVVGLAQLFKHPTYSSGFDLKMGLMQQYPETVYEQKSRADHSPDTRPEKVRKIPMRLTPDSSSAKFAATILAPYKALQDWDAVSFDYPSKKVAQARGIEQVNVLEESRKFFYDNVTGDTEKGRRARAHFDEVYHYYRSIEGQNFNDQLLTADEEPLMLRDVPKRPNNIAYFTADGTPTTCFATFSTGGIHGAEANDRLYREDNAEIEAYNAMIDEVTARFPDPLDIWDAKEVTLADGRVVPRQQILTSASRKKDLQALSQRLAEAADPAEDSDLALIDDVEERIAAVRSEFDGIGIREHKEYKPLFKDNADGSNKLDPKYPFTSAGRAIHEDFTSYYPNLLMNMSAFDNPDLGVDRYQKIFEDKERYGAMMKDPQTPAEEKARLSVLRNGTKLILNAASGAGDASHKNNIKMNNVIISMRLIGQLFSWRIGQAQTFAGGRIVSTNTDGLYVSGFDEHFTEEISNQVLAREAEATGVEIEPEPMLVVSKDANNRLELDVPAPGAPLWSTPIVAASGGTLACYKEPRPDKSLAHPAALDRALTEYLRLIVAEATPPWRREAGLGSLSLDEPLDHQTGLALMTDIRDKEDPVTALRLFQHIAAASSSVLSFPFLADPISQDDQQLTNLRTLQHFSRVFIVTEGTQGAASLHSAGAWKVNPASKLRRQRDGDRMQQIDHQVLGVLEELGFALDKLTAQSQNKQQLPGDQDIARRKVPGIEPTWNVIVDNRDLIELDEDTQRSMLDQLDLGVYVGWLAERFDKNWRNK